MPDHRFEEQDHAKIVFWLIEHMITHGYAISDGMLSASSAAFNDVTVIPWERCFDVDYLSVCLKLAMLQRRSLTPTPRRAEKLSIMAPTIPEK